MEVLPKWVVEVMEVQQLDRKVEEQMEEIEVMMKARDKDTFKHALEVQMMPSDEKLLKKISETQRAIREKEEILSRFRDHGYHLAGVQNHIIDNIYTRFSFANTNNQNMFLELDENLKEVRESYQTFKVEKKFTRNHEMDERQKDIERLSENMRVINRMFREVQDIVYVQGEVVDRIDYNISNADRNVISANKELDQILDRYRGFAMRCQIGLLIAIYILLLFILLKWLT